MKAEIKVGRTIHHKGVKYALRPTSPGALQEIPAELEGHPFLEHCIKEGSIVPEGPAAKKVAKADTKALAGAKEEAANIIAAAKQEAANIIAAANGEREAVLSATQEEVAAMKKNAEEEILAMMEEASKPADKKKEKEK